MLDYVRRALELGHARQALDLAEAHPVGAVAVAVVAILYLRLMLSGPRPY